MRTFQHVCQKLKHLFPYLIRVIIKKTHQLHTIKTAELPTEIRAKTILTKRKILPFRANCQWTRTAWVLKCLPWMVPAAQLNLSWVLGDVSGPSGDRGYGEINKIHILPLRGLIGKGVIYRYNFGYCYKLRERPVPRRGRLAQPQAFKQVSLSRWHLS